MRSERLFRIVSKHSFPELDSPLGTESRWLIPRSTTGPPRFTGSPSSVMLTEPPMFLWWPVVVLELKHHSSWGVGTLALCAGGCTAHCKNGIAFPWLSVTIIACALPSGYFATSLHLMSLFFLEYFLFSEWISACLLSVVCWMHVARYLNDWDNVSEKWWQMGFHVAVCDETFTVCEFEECCSACLSMVKVLQGADDSYKTMMIKTEW